MNAMFDRLFRRVQMLVGRGTISAVDDSGPVQYVQLRMNPGETGDRRPRLAEYGFACYPHPGCNGVAVFIGGNRSDGIVIATGDQRYRLHLTEGEVAIHDDQGQKVHLTRAGIVVDGGGLPLTIQNVPNTTMSGNLVVAGNISDQAGTKGTLQHVRDNYDVHTHPNVQSGLSSTGTPSNTL